MTHPSIRPYKNIAAALLFSIIFGPVGLLYASLWGGIAMIIAAFIVLHSGTLLSMLLFWIICCIWSVAAVEKYNRDLVRQQ